MVTTALGAAVTAALTRDRQHAAACTCTWSAASATEAGLRILADHHRAACTGRVITTETT